MNAVSGLDAAPKLPDVPAGLPSDLLERRPDIRAAEHQLLAANANIGARAPPSSPPSHSRPVARRASSRAEQSVRHGVRRVAIRTDDQRADLRRRRELRQSRHCETGEAHRDRQYEKTIQSAFHDVSDALNARGTYVAQVQAEQNLVDADSRYYQLANMRFEAGIENYLNVLVAENSLLIARLNLVSLELAAQQNSITLYMALGGGWQETSAPAASLP